MSVQRANSAPEMFGLALGDQLEGDRSDQGARTEPGQDADHAGRYGDPADGQSGQEQRRLCDRGRIRTPRAASGTSSDAGVRNSRSAHEASKSTRVPSASWSRCRPESPRPGSARKALNSAETWNASRGCAFSGELEDARPVRVEPELGDHGARKQLVNELQLHDIDRAQGDEIVERDALRCVGGEEVPLFLREQFADRSVSCQHPSHGLRSPLRLE